MIVQFGQIFAQAGNSTSSILFWSMGLIVLVVLMWVLIAAMRKRLSPKSEMGASGFTLADLRDLRKKGAISQEEFERAKVKIVENMQSLTKPAGEKGKSQS